MTQSLCRKLFIKGAFVGSWGRKQALEDSHQEAGQKVLSKATLKQAVWGVGGGRRGRAVSDILYHGPALLPALFDQEMPEQLIVCCRDQPTAVGWGWGQSVLEANELTSQ